MIHRPQQILLFISRTAIGEKQTQKVHTEVKVKCVKFMLDEEILYWALVFLFACTVYVFSHKKCVLNM